VRERTERRGDRTEDNPTNPLGGFSMRLTIISDGRGYHVTLREKGFGTIKTYAQDFDGVHATLDHYYRRHHDRMHHTLKVCPLCRDNAKDNG
jgi:hypothetical protein